MAARIITGVISTVCVDAGDAPEMQTRLTEALLANPTLFIAEVSLAGTGNGPRWLCELSLSDSSNTGILAPTVGALGARAFVVQAGDPEALAFEIDRVLDNIGTPSNYVAIRVAGAGSGRDYMAVVIVRILIG